MQNLQLNLILRFILEILALISFVYWGWTKHKGLEQIFYIFIVPLTVMIIWGTFRVSDDPGPAPVEIPGYLRLLFEILVFTIAIFFLYDVKQEIMAYVFGLIVLGHYILDYKRIIWLLTGN